MILSRFGDTREDTRVTHPDRRTNFVSNIDVHIWKKRHMKYQKFVYFQRFDEFFLQFNPGLDNLYMPIQPC